MAMRLTLRTLLAYRDGVLSPADSEDLHRRIQLSQDAGNLLKRIGAVTKSPQGLAPPVLGNGLGADPNSMAEYLDDALQHAQVPELERVCLVSDVQLAELADCHELLSTALHTKVVVPAELRRQAIAIGDPQQREEIQQQIQTRSKSRQKSGRRANQVFRHDAPHATGGGPVADAAAAVSLVAVEVQAPMVASGGESIKPQGLNLETSTLAHEVPEYLMGSRAGNWRIPAAIGGLLALLGVLIWQMLGPWDGVRGLFDAPGRLAGGVPAAGASNREALQPDPLLDEPIVESEQVPPGLGGAAGGQPATSTPNPEGSGRQEGGGSGVGGDAVGSGTAAADIVGADIVGDSAAPPGLAISPEVDSMAPPGAAASAPPSADLASDSSPSTRWLPQDELDRQAVLLIQSGGKLHRLQPGEASPAGSRWLAPPTTRTTIDLPQGALWTVCGPSLLQFGFAAEPRLPTVHTQLCRSLIRGGPDGRQLLLSTPLGAYRLELADASSRASIEVSYRPTRPGSVLERRAFKPVLIIVAAEGSLTVHVQSAVPSAAAENGAANGDSRPANQPQAISLALGDGLAVVAGENMEKFRLQNIPRWYRSSVEREVDGLAGEDLHHFLDAAAESDPGLWQTLSTLSGYRRPETAALAGQLSLMAGNWQPLVADYLNNERMRSHWKNTLDLSRQIVASDSAAAEALRTAFVDAHGERGQKLFELLCGLSEEQLAGNGLEELVKNLEAERLDQRVLAIYQLFLLTGKSLGYQPHAPTRASVLAWRKELQANRLSVVPPPDVIWERIPR